MIYSFEWDTDKAKINLIKHDISFEDAASIFRDSNALTLFDDSHSVDEERWITFGLSLLESYLLSITLLKKLIRGNALSVFFHLGKQINQK